MPKKAIKYFLSLFPEGVGKDFAGREMKVDCNIILCDYKNIYEKTYELIFLSISNENVIFEYINKFQQKLFSKINLLRNFIR